MDPQDEQAHETLLEGEGTSGADSLCALQMMQNSSIPQQLGPTSSSIIQLAAATPLSQYTPKQHGMPTQTTGMPKKSQVNTAATLSILHDIGVPEEEGD
jgi:hypothetical protein